MLIDLQDILTGLKLVLALSKPTPSTLLGDFGSIISHGQISNTDLQGVDGLLDGFLGLEQPTTSAAVTELDAASSASASLPSNASTPVSSGPDLCADPLEGAWLDDASTDDTSANSTCAFTPYEPALVNAPTFDPFDPSVALNYRYRQQQAVNLGSWFVQEQWMVPSLFTCAAGPQQAELDVAQGWGGVEEARQVLELHWDQWITESDFEYLASVGINTVRLPIGFWSLGPIYCQGTVFEPVASVYTNAWARVLRAISWAAKYGLGVLVDLHGAPGSQNGQAHAGTSDGQQNLFDDPTNIQLTINVLTYLTQQLVTINNVVGIEILNEPSNVDSLPSFYTNALSTLRQVSPEAATFPFYINDAYDLQRFADYISTRQDFVVLDHHSYFVFDSTDENTPVPQVTSEFVPGQGTVSDQLLSASSEDNRNIVVEEWSCALSSQSLANATDADEARREFCTGQMESYANATAGWGFWSYRTEGCDDDPNWCFRSAVGSSLPSTFFSYPNTSFANASSIANDTNTADVSPDQSLLSFGTTGSSTSYSPPSPNQWPVALGDLDPEYDQVNAVLSEAALDEQGAPAVSQRSFLLSSTTQQHRFVARHMRKFARGGSRSHGMRRDELSGTGQVEFSPTESAMSKGYEDGWDAAGTFANFNGSRLGFTGQFMTDALSAMNGAIVSSDEPYYKSWFVRGLADGELQVIKQGRVGMSLIQT